MLERVVVRRGREHWQQEKVLEGGRNATLLAGAVGGGGLENHQERRPRALGEPLPAPWF